MLKEILYEECLGNWLEKRMLEEETPNIRGGMSGRLLPDDTPIGSSEQSCPRVALLRYHGVSKKPSLTSFMTWEIGFGWENLFEKIKTSPRISNLEKDKKVEGKYGFRGSIDIFANLDGEPTVFELKSVSSVSSFEKVFINRNPPDSYISQCAAYMLATGAKQGFLVFGFFSYVGKEYMTAGTRAKLGEKLAPDITEFKITIENDDILIDGQFHCPVSVIERHQEVVTDSLKTGIPYPIRSQGGMCFFCPFKKVCDSLDRGEINGDFVEQCRKALYE